MKEKRKMTVKAAAVSAVMMICSSITVFAYEPPKSMDLDSHFPKEKRSEPLQSNEMLSFTLDTSPEVEEADDLYEVVYDAQFKDENGNIYKVDHADQKASCVHSYVKGIYSDHIKNKDGSCSMKVYSAKRCTKCGQCVIGELKYTLSYPKCNH